MSQIQQLKVEKPLPPVGRAVHGNEHGELPVDDPPPVDHPSEHYAAWRASAIFNGFVPFSSPIGK
jgi:hypothetical protein